jgi:hypothetical protein
MLLSPGQEDKSWATTNKERFSEIEALERDICVVSFLCPLLSMSQRDSQNLHASSNFLYFWPSVRIEKLGWIFCNLIYGIVSRKFVVFSGFGENLSDIADTLYEDIRTC